MRLLDIELVTPDRHSLGAGPPVEVHNAGIRLDIASGFCNLKQQMPR